MSEESSVGVEPPSQYDPPVGKEFQDCRGEWHVPCVFCDHEEVDEHLDFALLKFRNHARGTHYHYPSDKYLNKTDMAAAKERRRRYQSVMGTPSEGGIQSTTQMNREGL